MIGFIKWMYKKYKLNNELNKLYDKRGKFYDEFKSNPQLKGKSNPSREWALLAWEIHKKKEEIKKL